MGKIEKIITALGVLTPAEYSKTKSFEGKRRDLFNDKASNAIYDAVVANGRIEKQIRLENANRLESAFTHNNKLTAVLGNSACMNPKTNSRTRKEIRELGVF